MIKIKIPCSTSNLGPGFDTLGLALNRYLYIAAEEADTFSITVEGRGKEHIATNETNLVYSAMSVAARHVGKKLPIISLHLINEIPAFGGLGGSGAAIAGGIFLANELLNGGLSRDEMLSLAVGIEGHPDNVSAALMGGLTINCFDANRKIHCQSVKIEKPLSVVTCSPHFQVQTKQARKILPEQVELRDAVTNVENVASLVAAILQGEYNVLRFATVDMLHEKHRAALIPGFTDVKQAAIDAGALSCNISGAGPTLFSFALSNQEAIGSAMVRAFERNEQKSSVEIMTVENTGVHITD